MGKCVERTGDQNIVYINAYVPKGGAHHREFREHVIVSGGRHSRQRLDRAKRIVSQHRGGFLDLRADKIGFDYRGRIAALENIAADFDRIGAAEIVRSQVAIEFFYVSGASERKWSRHQSVSDSIEAKGIAPGSKISDRKG